MLVKKIIFILTLQCIFFSLHSAHSPSKELSKEIKSIRKKTIQEHNGLEDPAAQVKVIEKGEEAFDEIQKIAVKQDGKKQSELIKQISSVRSELSRLKDIAGKKVQAEEKKKACDDWVYMNQCRFAKDLGDLDVAQKVANKISNARIRELELDAIKQLEAARKETMESMLNTPRNFVYPQQKIQKRHSKNLHTKLLSKELPGSLSQNEDFFTPFTRKQSARRRSEFTIPNISPDLSPPVPPTLPQHEAESQPQASQEQSQPPQSTMQNNKTALTILATLAGVIITRAGYRYYRTQQKSTYAQLITLSNSFDETDTEKQNQARALLHRLIQELHARIPQLPEQQKQHLWALIEYIEVIEYNTITKDILVQILNNIKGIL